MTKPMSKANRTPMAAMRRMLFVSRLPQYCAAQHEDSTLNAADEHLQQRLQLAADIHTGNRTVAERADHHVICKADRKGYGVLQRNRYRERDERFVGKLLSLVKNMFPPPESAPQTQYNSAQSAASLLRIIKKGAEKKSIQKRAAKPPFQALKFYASSCVVTVPSAVLVSDSGSGVAVVFRTVCGFLPSAG